MLASVKFLEKQALFFCIIMFGLFIYKNRLTANGLSMVMTSFTMSLLFISVIYYTTSIWTAVTLHITGNFLLHSLGFDEQTTVVSNKISVSTINGFFSL